MKDVDGKVIKVGDVVRILGVPGLAGMTSEAQADSQPVFKYLVGKCKRVAGVDKMGNAQISFHLKTGNTSVVHWIGIEPRLLRKPGKRKSQDQHEGRSRQTTPR